MALLAAAEVRRFGLSRASRCCRIRASAAPTTPSARKMRDALRLVRERAPDLEVEGEMHADAALSRPILDRVSRTRRSPPKPTC